MLVKRVSRLRERDAIAASVEQCQSKLLFEPCDGREHSGMRAMQLCCSRLKPSFLNDGIEALQVMKRERGHVCFIDKEYRNFVILFDERSVYDFSHDMTYDAAKEEYDMMDHTIFTTLDGCEIAWRLDGNADLPVLMLSNSIGTDLHMWDTQMPALTREYRVLRYDMRGHGQSGVPVGAYSLDRLGHDALELLDALNLSTVHFCGLSLGGMVGQWLGIHAPERIERLVLCHTAPFIGPRDQWDARIRALLASTRDEIAAQFIANWFPASMRDAAHPSIEPFRATLRATNPRGIAGCLAAVRDMDLRRVLGTIPCATLVIAGAFDTVTLPEHGEQIAAAIPHAQLRMLPAVHMSNVELSAAFDDVVLGFLRSESLIDAG